MTPAARAAAAIAVLDRILTGEAAEKALTSWGRSARYAGSGDRSTVRDIVFEAIRCKRSFASLGGGLTGRGLVLGGIRAAGQDAGLWFDGSPYGPASVTAADQGRKPLGNDSLDIPDWLAGPLQAALGNEFQPVMLAMRQRAPVFLRTNAARATPEEAIAILAEDGITAQRHSLAKFALEVTYGARKIQNSRAYAKGLVELQDAASQAVVEALPLTAGMRVLDLCAGGGGKTLAMAAKATVQIWAHDASPRRMVDLPARAERAKAAVTLTDAPERFAPYDLVLADVPCSGSGSWRRDPEGKWALTPGRLDELRVLQAQILDRAAAMVAIGGQLGFVTCSLLREENEDQVAAFLARTAGFAEIDRRRFTPLQGGDGFFLSILGRDLT